jgi:hypothetical protein
MLCGSEFKEGKMDDLKEMEEQSQRGASLAAKQAYINALEYRVKELEDEKEGMVRLTEADMKKLGWSYR